MGRSRKRWGRGKNMINIYCTERLKKKNKHIKVLHRNRNLGLGVKDSGH